MPSATTPSASLPDLLSSLQQSLSNNDNDRCLHLLSQAKRALLLNNALIPSPSLSSQTFQTARSILELGALVSIRTQDSESFVRYYSQLQPFYDSPSAPSSSSSQRSKITGLYLMLLLSQGDYAGFHTVLEGLVEQSQGKGLEEDAFINYPVELERSLMEGSYDKVWRSTKAEVVPCEEFGLFTEVLVHTIRAEIASCAQTSYASLPISNAKNLLFLDSEGAVVEFAEQRGWMLKDGRIYFPDLGGVGAGPGGAGSQKLGEKEILLKGGEVIENTLGYARELETIV
ncbi:MAG: hypothetical protein Q9227_001944 [Pyrenula ochraceoflavens]